MHAVTPNACCDTVTYCTEQAFAKLLSDLPSPKLALSSVGASSGTLAKALGYVLITMIASFGCHARDKCALLSPYDVASPDAFV